MKITIELDIKEALAILARNETPSAQADLQAELEKAILADIKAENAKRAEE